ncbi:F-box/kelch-repeat protein At3g23880-like [Impatiens glandulifera]|uniref:F-box/kelch-repeat protein At3g23880-like n=1 Tax=Impatiens glandulifera TaxID=253017 RepID=UPI001FB096F6|nr:F-box/kelch-repeat protein At3g23880-like [Impatiens glandulifera]
MEFKIDPTTDADGGRNRRKTVQLSSASTSTVYLFTGSLSSDLISEIIIRLPVKFLLQLRCVSKSWCTLISDPIFVKKHLKASTQKLDYADHRIIMNTMTNPFVLKTYSMSSVFHDEFPNPDFLDYPLNHLHRLVKIVGSVNGLLCLTIGNDDVVIWNPTTRKSKRLPKSDSKMYPGQYVVYGFGYDEDTDDYKVVVITSELISFEFPLKSDIKVYGLKSDSWRKIEGCPKDLPMINARGIFVSGSLHWIAARNGEMDDWRSTTILSFDVSKETYSEILQPPYGDETSNPVLGVLSGCLFLLRNVEEIKGEVWVMKEYGNVESWSKLFSIPYLDGPIDFNSTSPIYIFKKNEVILLLGFRMLLFNINNNTVRYPNIMICSSVDTYIESLVSPCLE